MAAEPLNSGTSDPLSEIYGPALFPRTFSASAGNPMPADYKNIDSLHQVMKSLKELRSPDKLMNEAKRIVDGGVELQESNLLSFVGSVSVTHDIASKVKDKPRERRPGLGIARKKGTFSLRATVSQPHVSFEPTVKIDQLQDPDEFFDDYDRRENARKEIQRLLGGTSDNVNQQRPSLPRHRRPGILGKSYTYNHRYSSTPSENDNVLRPSQEMGEESISNSPEDVPLENVISLDFIPAVDLEDDEPAGKRTENKSSNLLNELLSYSNEDLNGDGALYHLQRLLNIKPLDLEGLSIPEVYYAGSPSTLMAGESLQKPEKDSVQVHKVLTNLNSGQTVGHELVTRSLVLHATSHSPRSPFSSMSLLMKRIMKPNPPKDPFFPHDAELSSSQKVCLVQPTDKLHEQVDTSYDLGMPDFDSQGEAEIAEAVISNSVSLKMTETKDNYSDQFVDEATGGPDRDACIMPNEEPDPNIQESKNYNNSHNIDNPNPSSLEDEAMEGKSTCSQNDSEQQPEVYQRKLHIPDKAGENRIRKAHPMRKSLADCGSSFETGVRRSKRIKMRRLEYWKGERFLYGRVDNSLKLIGVKYLSPGKGDMVLKVKPYLPSESTEIKELLDLESRH